MQINMSSIYMYNIYANNYSFRPALGDRCSLKLITMYVIRKKVVIASQNVVKCVVD